METAQHNIHWRAKVLAVLKPMFLLPVIYLAQNYSS